MRHAQERLRHGGALKHSLRMRSQTLLVRSASSRVSSHEATGKAANDSSETGNAPDTKSRMRTQYQPCRRFKFGDGLRRADDLDRGHAHFARRLQVDAEIVKIDATCGVDVKCFDHHPVDARIGLR